MPIEKFLLKQLCQASYFNIMADECTDVATTHEEMSVFCTCWLDEDGVPGEHFLEIVNLKKADAESIYFALYSGMCELEFSRIIGMVLMERKLEFRQGLWR